jgi:FkbM family methyltransferase
MNGLGVMERLYPEVSTGLSGIDFKHIDRATLERICLQNALIHMLDPVTANCKVIDHWIQVDVRDRSLAPYLMRLGLWEPWITVAFLKDLNRNDRFLDVGANFGWYSLIAHMAGAKVIGAIEASERVANLLQNTFEQNLIPGKILQYAAWSESGVFLHLANDIDNQGGASVMVGPDVRRSAGQEVSTIRLDDVEEFQSLDVVKIDVESAEMEVWRGMRKIRQNNPNLRVWMEFTPCGQSSPLECLQEIEYDGFEIQEVTGAGGLIKRPLEIVAAIPEWTMLYLRRPR